MLKEYGSERRPFSDSPTPPRSNDQFTGLADGSIHADELLSGSSATERSFGRHGWM